MSLAYPLFTTTVLHVCFEMVKSLLQHKKNASPKKHGQDFRNAIRYCRSWYFSEQGDGIAFYEKPFVKFERLLETYLAFAPRGFESFAKAMLD